MNGALPVLALFLLLALGLGLYADLLQETELVGRRSEGGRPARRPGRKGGGGGGCHVTDLHRSGFRPGNNMMATR
jgi:hypothetical protein